MEGIGTCISTSLSNEEYHRSMSGPSHRVPVCRRHSTARASGTRATFPVPRFSHTVGGSLDTDIDRQLGNASKGFWGFENSSV